MPPPFPAGADLLASWTPSHEQIPRWLRVTVIEQVTAPLTTPSEVLPPGAWYRVQTNMGVAMVLPEADLTDFPAAETAMPQETDFGEP